MRTITLLLIFCFILLCAGCSRQKDSEEKVSVTAPAVRDGKAGSGGAVSDAPVTAAGVMTGEVVKGKKEKNRKKEKKTVRIVTDPTGKKRKLKIGKVNIENEGIKFCFATPPSDYAQVYGGHYYYLRSDGSGNYTIYRDKGEKVGEFSLKGESVSCLVKYRSEFYAVTQKQYIYMKKKDWEEVEYPEFGYQYTIALVDLKKNKVMPLRDAGPIVDCNFFENSLVRYNVETGICAKSRIGDENTESPVPIPSSTAEHYTPSFMDIKLIDGKWYYGTVADNVVTLWSLDLTSWKKEKLFCYKFKEDYEAWDYRYAFTPYIDDIEIMMIMGFYKAIIEELGGEV